MPRRQAPPPASEFSELLRPPAWMWLVTVTLEVLLAVEVYLIAGAVAGFIAICVLGVGAGVLLESWALLVEVKGGVLIAGRASIPVTLLGERTPLEGSALRLRTGRDADPAAHLAVRPWTAHALELELRDPADPAPYWLVGTRDPARLAAALSAAAGEPRPSV